MPRRRYETAVNIRFKHLYRANTLTLAAKRNSLNATQCLAFTPSNSYYTTNTHEMGYKSPHAMPLATSNLGIDRFKPTFAAFYSSKKIVAFLGLPTPRAVAGSLSSVSPPACLLSVLP